MKLHFLGTGASYPTTKRGVSSIALQLDEGDVWIFDCGEGTQIQLQKVNVSRAKISRIFITHLHGDHLFGLPGLLCTMSSQMRPTECPTEGNVDLPIVDVYGPVGIRRFLYTALSLSRSALVFRLRITELLPLTKQYPPECLDWVVDHSSPVEMLPLELPFLTCQAEVDSDLNAQWKLIDNEHYCVNAGWIHHRIPTFGFVVTEKDKPGSLDILKLREFGIKPGPICGQLKNGHDLTLPDGRVVTSQMVVGSPISGRKLVILGDTDDPIPMADMAKNCDVLIHESTHDDTLSEKAQAFAHSTPSQAAAFAKLTQARVLLLNHFSQRYAQESSERCEKSDTTTTVNILKTQAEKFLEGTNTVVHCAFDSFVYSVPFNKFKATNH